MRNIGCSLTLRQVYSRRKTETRRLEWQDVKAGDLLQFVDRTMGFRKGQHPRPVAVVQVSDVRREPLYNITQESVFAEGFPAATRHQFVEAFCHSMQCRPTRFVTVIKFGYVPGGRSTWEGICRGCGCVEDDACQCAADGSCSWVDFDLCSHCADYGRNGRGILRPTFQGDLLSQFGDEPRTGRW